MTSLHEHTHNFLLFKISLFPNQTDKARRKRKQDLLILSMSR